MNQWRGEEYLEVVEGGETVVRIYYIKFFTIKLLIIMALFRFSFMKNLESHKTLGKILF